MAGTCQKRSPKRSVPCRSYSLLSMYPEALLSRRGCWICFGAPLTRKSIPGCTLSPQPGFWYTIHKRTRCVCVSHCKPRCCLTVFFTGQSSQTSRGIQQVHYSRTIPRVLLKLANCPCSLEPRQNIATLGSKSGVEDKLKAKIARVEGTHVVRLPLSLIRTTKLIASTGRTGWRAFRYSPFPSLSRTTLDWPIAP